MIYLGWSDDAKRAAIAGYQAAHDIRQTVVISADDFPLPVPDTDQVKYSDVIIYVTFYPLLQKIDKQTLVVINECLRTQNRYDLAYNCIRNYLNQTDHQLVFQLLPLIDAADDFMVLFDFDTKSRWKRRPFDPLLIQKESTVTVKALPVGFTPVPVPTSAKTKTRYAREHDKLFKELGKRDPHIIPRNLYLLGGEDKLAFVQNQTMPLFASGGEIYVARNKRLKMESIVTYPEVRPGQTYTVVDLPHRFIDFADFIQRTGQAHSEVLAADLKVDEWYITRYQAWSERIKNAYTDLSQ